MARSEEEEASSSIHMFRLCKRNYLLEKCCTVYETNKLQISADIFFFFFGSDIIQVPPGFGTTKLVSF